jgi:hypothetical protein
MITLEPSPLPDSSAAAFDIDPEPFCYFSYFPIFTHGVCKDKSKRQSLNETYIDSFHDSSSTYDHRVWKTGLPVRSAVLKPHAGELVVGWVTTSESSLLYVFLNPIFVLVKMRDFRRTNASRVQEVMKAQSDE